MNEYMKISEVLDHTQWVKGCTREEACKELEKALNSGKLGVRLADGREIPALATVRGKAGNAQ